VSRASRLLAVAAALLLFAGLGARDFWEPDEPRHGAIAEEMRALRFGAGQLVLPRLNGEVYDQKPPLYYWLAALAGAPFGRVSEGAARLPSALAALLTALLVARFGREAFGAASGLAAAAVFVSLPFQLEIARSARPDALLMLFVSAALWLGWRIDQGLADSARGRTLLHGAVALGVLAKGPVAALLPALGLLAHLGWERRLRDARRLVSPAALLLSLGVPLGWLTAAATLAPDGYLREAVTLNLFGRFFTGTDHERSFGFYLARLPFVFLPWTLAWPLALLAARADLAGCDARRASGVRLLVAFVGAGLLFFSLSAGKRNVYLLPLIPALAILVGHGLDVWLSAAVRAGHGWLRRFAPAAVAALAAGELAVFGYYLPALNERRSIRPSAVAAAQQTPAGTPVGLLRNGALVGGVAYYSERPVSRLGSAKGVRRFVEDGGRVVIADRRDVPIVDSAAEARVAFRQLVEEDEMVVLVIAARTLDREAAP
jgi:4-amino-4-deoxy-L-arabinose transferase-like glycosyltransferase